MPSPPWSLGASHRVYAWLASALGHAGLMLAFMSLVSRLHPVPVSEPFRWDVSFTEPRGAVVSPSVQANATEHLQTASVSPSHKAAKPMAQRLDTQEPAPLLPTLEKRPTLNTQPMEPSPPPQPMVHEAVADPVVEQSAGLVVSPTPAAVAEPEKSSQTPMTHQTVHPGVSETAIAKDVVDVELRRSSDVAVRSSEGVAEPIVTDHQNARDTSHHAGQQPVEPTQTASTHNADPVVEEKIASHPEVSIHQEVVAPSNSQDLPQSVAPPSQSPRRDFGWVAEMLLSRLQALRQYPPEARVNGWQGRVLLRVVITEGGHLQDVAIEQSSGYRALDLEAMERLRRAFPLPLEHDIGQSHVVLRIPIRYELRH